MTLRPIVSFHRRPSRVRVFCAWLRDAGRWLNEPMAPSQAMRLEQKGAEPAPAWGYYLLGALLGIGLYATVVSLLSPHT